MKGNIGYLKPTSRDNNIHLPMGYVSQLGDTYLFIYNITTYRSTYIHYYLSIVMNYFNSFSTNHET